MLNSRVKWPRWCIFLGDASYSVYLFHILIVYQVCSRALQFLVQNGIMVMSAEIAAIAAIAVSIVAGSAIHQAIEKPVTTYLHTRAKRRMQEKSATS
jgi:exopolysaccharide production protein ExoZ